MSRGRDELEHGQASAAVVTEGLTRDFGALRAVDGLSLNVPPGTVFGFLGPNGSGKTTTIRLLLGLIKPTSGRASVLGVDPDRDGNEVGRAAVPSSSTTACTSGSRRRRT